MTQKACEGGFCHVMTFAFIFEMSQNRRISISVLFLFEYLFLEMPHFQSFEIFEMLHVSHLVLKIGKLRHFKIFEQFKMGHFYGEARDSNTKTAEIEILRFWGI